MEDKAQAKMSGEQVAAFAMLCAVDEYLTDRLARTEPPPARYYQVGQLTLFLPEAVENMAERLQSAFDELVSETGLVKAAQRAREAFIQHLKQLGLFPRVYGSPAQLKRDAAGTNWSELLDDVQDLYATASPTVFHAMDAFDNCCPALVRDDGVPLANRLFGDYFDWSTEPAAVRSNTRMTITEDEGWLLQSAVVILMILASGAFALSLGNIDVLRETYTVDGDVRSLEDRAWLPDR